MGDGPAFNDWQPAPYGEACTHCVRAKCKCFIRSGGRDCERCHRLNRSCQRAISTRKRKPEHKDTGARRRQPSSPSRPGESRASNVPENALSTPDLTPSAMDTASLLGGHERLPDNDATRIPRVVMDTEKTSIVLERLDTQPQTLTSSILDDIFSHQVRPQQAAEQLAIFRDTFLPVFPCVDIPNTLSAEVLRASRPFLWLVIMALTQKVVAQQYTMVDTAWQIISHRVVTQHCVNMDLLVGIICLSAWSHYFKEDRPFMDMLTHIAVSMAFDMKLHQDQAESSTQEKSYRFAQTQLAQQQARSLEERRTIIAVYHLSHATWKAYRKTEPIRWTAYMDRCLAILDIDGTDMDRLLTAQIHCQLISDQADPAAGDNLIGQRTSVSSAITTAALLRELKAIQPKLPAQFQEDGTMKLYLWASELAIRERAANHSRTVCSGRLDNIQKLKDLENVLETASRWLELLMSLPLQWWVGMTTDLFSQVMHCLVVLFRLTTLVNEPGWDMDEARRQADVLAILDCICGNIESSSEFLGIDDTHGPRRGIVFKGLHVMRALRALFVAEISSATAMTSGSSVTDSSVNTPFADLPTELPEDFWKGLMDEPWFTDIFDNVGIV